MIMNKWRVLPLMVSTFLAIAAIAGAQQTIRLIVNGKELQPEVPPQLVKGRVLVPVRTVAEALQAEVKWDELSQTVTIHPKKPQQQVVASLPEANAVLYAVERDGFYEKFELKVNDKVRSFPNWKSVSHRNPQLLYNDINNDALKEIIVHLTTGTGTGLYLSEARVIQADDTLQERYVEDPLPIAWKNVKSKISAEGVTLNIGENQIIISKDQINSKPESWFQEVFLENQISYHISEQKLKAYIGIQISPTEYIGEIEITYSYKDHLFQGSNLKYKPPS